MTVIRFELMESREWRNVEIFWIQVWAEQRAVENYKLPLFNVRNGFPTLHLHTTQTEQSVILQTKSDSKNCFIRPVSEPQFHTLHSSLTKLIFILPTIFFYYPPRYNRFFITTKATQIDWNSASVLFPFPVSDAL